MAFNFDTNERVASLKRSYRKTHNLDKAKAVWGDAFGNIADPNRPGKVLVRVMTSNGLSVARSVWAPRIPFGVKVGDSVMLKYENGRLMVDGPDHAAMLSTGINPVARAQQYDSPSTPQSYLETLRLVVKSGMLVSLKGWNVIANGHFYPVSYPGIDLTASVPSAGEMCYAGIFVLSDFTDVEIVTSTPRGVTDEPLDDDDVDELLAAASAGSTPAWAVKLIGGQTSIDQNEIDHPLPGGTTDLRQAINGPDALGGGNVVGPASSTDNALARFDSVTGKAIQNSGVIVDDSNSMTLPGRFVAQSGQNVKVRVVTAAGAVTVTTSDFLVVVNKTVGAATVVNLPASPVAGDSYVIKDGKFDLATNNITLTPATGNIDNAATYVMNINGQSATIVYSGAQWLVI